MQRKDIIIGALISLLIIYGGGSFIPLDTLEKVFKRYKIDMLLEDAYKIEGRQEIRVYEN